MKSLVHGAISGWLPVILQRADALDGVPQRGVARQQDLDDLLCGSLRDRVFCNVEVNNFVPVESQIHEPVQDLKCGREYWEEIIGKPHDRSICSHHAIVLRSRKSGNLKFPI